MFVGWTQGNSLGITTGMHQPVEEVETGSMSSSTGRVSHLEAEMAGGARRLVDTKRRKPTPWLPCFPPWQTRRHEARGIPASFNGPPLKLRQKSSKISETPQEPSQFHLYPLGAVARFPCFETPAWSTPR